MFEHYILASNIERVVKRFSMARLPDSECYEPSYNISKGSIAYVITNSQTKDIRSFRFGIKGLGKKFPEQTCFVRSEGDRNKNDDPSYTGSRAIFLQPDLRTIIRTKRCLVLADAFVVGEDTPHLVYLRNKQRPFAFAGIWTEDQDGVESFAIVTAPSNRLLYKLGLKRMPVVLRIEDENRWLRPSTELGVVLGMLDPYPTELMNACPILNSDQSDISIVQPIGRPILEEPKAAPFPRKKRKVKESANTTTWGEREGWSGKT